VTEETTRRGEIGITVIQDAREQNDDLIRYDMRDKTELLDFTARTAHLIRQEGLDDALG